MVSLIDIGEIKGSAKLRGQDVSVIGITSEDLVALFHTYPDLRKLVTGKADQDTISALINQFPLAVADIIALGTGYTMDSPDWKKATETARRLGVGEQFVILQEIGRITFPQGITSFLDAVAAAVGTESVTAGWARATKSQKLSSDASPRAETSEPAGDQRPGS